ncbi:MAG TPA: heparinase II/III family protein [Bryobacteraceae bacterium]|nr:heparinase II/III family protein [Bryobacteraceae bacterium]
MPPITRRELPAAAASLHLATSAALSSAAVPAPATKRPANILTGDWTPAKLATVLVSRDDWKPFPAADNRHAWEGLPPQTRKVLVDAGEAEAHGEWPTLPATLFLGFARDGNRSRYERVNGIRRARLRALVAAECVEGKGRFLDEIANGIWTTCEESFWGYPAHLSLQRLRHGLPDVSEPVVDLFAAETGSLLAWTAYLLGARLDNVSPMLRLRIQQEIDRRILTPNFERNDFWWMGLDPNGRANLNNWTPWIDSNWLTCALLEERDPKRRAATVHKIMRSLDRFLAVYHDDGGCDEGPGYWSRAGGSLFDCLELLRSGTRGTVNVYRVPLIQEIGRYIYRAHIAGEYVINFADASAKARIGGDLVFRYGRRIGDSKMQSFGAWAAAQYGTPGGSGDGIGRQLASLFDRDGMAAVKAEPPLVRDVWLPGIQVMAARLKEGSTEGLYVAAQGGHNAESHNHNDVGNFVVYADGKPAIVDVGVETYTAKTFSSRRYEIWTMQSAYHNVPTVGGVMQATGRQFAATEVSHRSDDTSAEIAMNIEAAYPPEAGIEKWRRKVMLDRKANEVRISDRFDLKKRPDKITVTLMTPCEVKPGEAGELRLGPVRVLFDPTALKASVEEIRIEDGRLKTAWGDRMFRILLIAEKPPENWSWTVRVVQTRTP